jgi:hypothetical protein
MDRQIDKQIGRETEQLLMNDHMTSLTDARQCFISLTNLFTTPSSPSNSSGVNTSSLFNLLRTGARFAAAVAALLPFLPSYTGG